MPNKDESESPYDFAPKSDPLPPRETQSAKPLKSPKPIKPPAAEPEAPPEPAYERICPHCGFKILTKPQKGRCPECAGALDVAADLLQFADGSWLASLSNGVLLLVASIIVHVAASIMVAFAQGRTGDLVHAIAGVIGAAGVWMATAHEPGGGVAKAPYGPPARLLALVVAALWAAALFLNHSVAPEAPLHKIAVILAMAFMAVEAVVVALHLRRFAVRVPNDSLATHLTNVGFIIGGMCLILGALKAVNVSANDLRLSFFCGFPALGCMALATLWLLLSLLRLAMEFRNSAVAGRIIVQRQEQRARAAAEKSAGTNR